MTAHDRPPIAISTCLLGEPVRWDGKDSAAPDLVAALRQAAVLVAVCPEADLGMGVPREPVQLEGAPGAVRMCGVETGRDWTVEMDRFLEGRIAALEPEGLSGWVLKARSPSCGLGDVKVFSQREATDRPATEPYTTTGSGLLPRRLRIRLPHLPVATDVQLAAPEVLSRFLERVRLYAAWRGRGHEREDLLRFHAEHGLAALGARGRDAADRLLSRVDIPAERQAERYAAVLFTSAAYEAPEA